MDKKMIKKISALDADEVSQIFPLLAKEEKEEIFEMSERKYSSPSDNEYSSHVSGVEPYKKKKFTVFARIAACFALCAALTGGAVYALRPGRELPPADIVENSENDIPETELMSEAGTDAPEIQETEDMVELTKEDVLERMLNTPSFFDKVSVKYIVSDTCDSASDSSFPCIITVYSDLNSGKAWTGRSHMTDTFTEEQAEMISGDPGEFFTNGTDAVEDGERTVFYSDGEKTYLIDGAAVIMTSDAKGDSGYRSAEDRHYIDDEGYDCWVYRTAPFNTYFADDYLLPQVYAMGFLIAQDKWEICGAYDNGRKNILLRGEMDGGYAEKLHTYSFIISIDAETGVLTGMICYDENGNISRYIYTKDLKFDSEAEEVPEIDMSQFVVYQPEEQEYATPEEQEADPPEIPVYSYAPGELSDTEQSLP